MSKNTGKCNTQGFQIQSSKLIEKYTNNSKFIHNFIMKILRIVSLSTKDITNCFFVIRKVNFFGQGMFYRSLHIKKIPEEEK